MVGIRERNATYPLPFYGRKVGRNSIFNLLHIPYNSHKERLVFSIIALKKVIIFSR